MSCPESDFNRAASGVPDPRLNEGSIDLKRGIGKRMPLGNAQHMVTSLPNGQYIEKAKSASAGAGVFLANFYTRFYKTVEGERHYFLKGGIVYGFGAVDDIDLTTQFAGLDDTHYLWLKITGNGNEQDGFIIGGFTPTAVEVGSGAAVPADDAIVTGDATGKNMYYVLGTAVGTASPLTLNFTPSSYGDLSVGYCPSAFTRARA